MSEVQSVCEQEELRWAEELDTYEKGTKFTDRNRMRKDYTLSYPGLFPYHEALYPLLDYYYHIPNDPGWMQGAGAPSPVTSIDRRAPPTPEERPFPEYLPNSAYAIYMSLLPRFRAKSKIWNLFDEEEGERVIGLGTHEVDISNLDFLLDWETEIWEEEEIVLKTANGIIWAGKSEVDHNILELMQRQNDSNSSDPRFSFGPDQMPLDNASRADVLTRVLRHATSELQYDHRLGQAAMLLMAEWRLFDDDASDDSVGRGTDRLSRVLATIAAGYVQKCDWRCHERFWATEDDNPVAPTHYCEDWKNLSRTLSTLVSNGITFVTERHAETLAAFVVLEYDSVSSAAAAVDQQFFEADIEANDDDEISTPTAKSLLQQNLFYHRNTSGFSNATSEDDAMTGHDVGESFRISMVYALIDGLGWHAGRDLSRLHKLAEMLAECGDEDDLELIKKTTDSYINCIRALVSIGESTIRRLPPNTRTAQLGGAIVRALVLANIDGADSIAHNPGYIGKKAESVLLKKSVASLTRYSDAVRDAAANVSYECFITNTPTIIKVCKGKVIKNEVPVKDVRDVVRGLFLRDLVDTRISGCGYGDYLVWCKLPVTPLDPLLYDHCLQYPEYSAQYPEYGAEEGGEAWDIDEEEKELTRRELAARYDFSLVMLQRTWHEPWTPKSHRSFSSDQKLAIKTLFLCSYRVRVPNDVAERVAAYLSRDWWPDDRKMCWCHDCQLTKLSSLLKQKVTARERAVLTNAHETHQSPERRNTNITAAQIPATMHNEPFFRMPSSKPQSVENSNSSKKTLFTCKCNVAMYCSKEHRQYFMRDGHKRMCGTPPFRPHGIDEELLCREVLAISSQEDAEGNSAAVVIDQGTIDNGEDADADADADGDADSDDLADDNQSCWESVDSNDEDDFMSSCRTRTETISKYFENRAYSRQAVQRTGLVHNG